MGKNTKDEKKKVNNTNKDEEKKTKTVKKVESSTNKKETKKAVNNKKVAITSGVAIVAAVVAILMFFVTGNKKLTCTQELKQSVVTIKTSIDFSFKMDKAEKADARFEVVLDDKYVSYKDQFIKKFKEQYSSYEKKYGINPKYETTDKGFVMTFTTNNDNFQKIMSISNNVDSYKNIKTTVEKQGYKCK